MGNDRCFVDTGCWIALLNKRDNLHKTADTIYKRRMDSGSSLVTTSSVLTETFNALANPAFQPSVIAFRRRLESSPRVEIVFVDPALWSRGWNIYEQRLGELPPACAGGFLRVSGALWEPQTCLSQITGELPVARPQGML